MKTVIQHEDWYVFMFGLSRSLRTIEKAVIQPEVWNDFTSGLSQALKALGKAGVDARKGVDVVIGLIAAVDFHRSEFLYLDRYEDPKSVEELEEAASAAGDLQVLVLELLRRAWTAVPDLAAPSPDAPVEEWRELIARAAYEISPWREVVGNDRWIRFNDEAGDLSVVVAKGHNYAYIRHPGEPQVEIIDL